MKEKQEGDARNFGVFLSQINGGSFLEELSVELREAIGSLEARASLDGGSAKGSITITLAIKAEDNGTVTIDPGVRVKLPPERRRRSVFWVTRGGNLSPNNPKQQGLPFREIAGGAEQARDVGGDPSVREVRGA